MQLISILLFIRRYKKTVIYGLKLLFTAVFALLVYLQISKRIDFASIYPIFKDTFFQTLFSPIALLVFLFTLANWALESLKWRILLKPIEAISWKASFKSILSGLPFAIITPNRVGEFGGRILVLSPENRKKGTFATWVGGWFQGYVTFFAGIPGLFVFKEDLERYFGLSFTVINIVYVIVVCLMPLVVVAIKMNASRFLLEPLQFLIHYTPKIIWKIIGLSALRYFIFCLQWMLLVVAVSNTFEWKLLLLMIPLSFAMSTILSFISLLEPVQRASVTMILGLAVGLEGIASQVAVCGFVLWCINLLFPSLIGLILIWLQPIAGKNDLD